MNKYIFALILTLLGWTQIQAQNTDLRSAPTPPKFQVTVRIGNVANGSVTAKVGNTVIESGAKVAYGSTVDFTIVTKTGHKLTKVANGSDEVTSFTDVTFADDQTTYKVSFKGLTGIADFQFTTELKTAINVSNITINNLNQTLPDIQAVTLVSHVSSAPAESFKIQYDLDGNGTYEDFDASKITKEGQYKVLITRPEDADHQAFRLEEKLNVSQKMLRLTYKLEQYVKSVTAKVGNSQIGSNAQFVANSQITFTIVTAKGYRIDKIKQTMNELDITSIEGKVAEDGTTVYTFVTAPIDANATFTFFGTAKEDLNQRFYVANKTQTIGNLKAPTIEKAPEGVEIQILYDYEKNGTWSDKFDAAKLAVGSYDIWIYRAEDLVYKELSYKDQLLINPAEQPSEPEQKIEIVLNTEKLAATSVEVGKPLSTSVLSGGYAVTADANKTTVVGTFEWKYPETVIKTASEDSYPVVFTPIDLRYAQAETSVKVKAIQYYTVTTSASANGKVEIKEANAANKYKAGTTLTLVYTPDAHYKVAANQPTTYQVEKDDVISGQFEAIMHKVTIAKTENGTLTVKNGETVVTDGTEVAEGTQLNITATPATGYKLATLTNGENPIRNNSITVEGDLNIQATFEALPAEEFVVTVADMANGKLLLLDKDGNSVNKGASVKKGTKLTVVAVADKGYELDGNIMVGDTKVSGTYEVTAATEFKASFKKISYGITKTTKDVTITVKKDGTEVTAAEIGDVLTIAAEVKNTNKRLLSLVVNGKEIANGDTYTVENAVNIVANLVDKATIQLLDLNQVVTYDGNEKQFVVRSIPAGLQGFTVKYDGAEAKPKDAENHGSKVYTVTITRDADEQYQAVNATGTLTIQAALANHKAPTWDKTNNKWTSDDGDVKDNSTGKADTDFRDVILTPKNTNHKKVTFSVAKELDANKKIIPSVSSSNAAALRATTTSSLSVEATGGTVTFWNGTAQVTEVYEGQTITIKGLPSAGNSSMANWTVGEKESPGEEVSLTVAAGENKVKVTFSQKAEPTSPTVSALTNDQYTGSVIIPSITSSLTGWNIVVKAGGLVVENPTEAGAYTVYASRSEDQVYAPVVEKEIGSYTIKPQALKAEAFSVTASAIMKGLSLSASTLSGEAPVAGTFAWAAPAEIAEGESEEATTSKAYKVTFTPDSKNYSASDLNLTATVPFLTAEKTPIRKISFEAAEHGTFVVKVNGTEVTSGTQITQGDKVEVTATPATGYSLEAVKINDTAVTGAYTVGESGDVTIVVTFKQNGSQGGDPITPDEPETITDPVVAERTATTAVITWEKIDGATGYKLHLYAKKGDATPLKTYEFDAEGNLKAAGISFTLTGLTAGESYYVETVAITPSGEVKRGIELTGTPTGIEAIAEGSQLYTVKGAIVIVPTSPIEVMIISANGRPIFHDEVSGYTQVTANAGIYVVVLEKGNEQVVEKVVVK